MTMIIRKLATLSLLSSSARSAKMGSGNMNGKYVVASGDKFGVNFNDDYASKGHEYFDVWAPEIATHYAEVFWTDQGNQALPDAIVKRFAGKVMAITGYEMDQVMVSPTGPPGVNPEKDVSVPINWAYNHHYMAWMTGKHSRITRVDAAPDDPMAHGATTKLISEDLPSARLRADPSIPTAQMFSEGNGGESRKSFHGYPNGYAQLIDSPTQWHITPMQVDTRNRDCGATPVDINNCTKFTPGPEPRQARYGRGIPKEGTNYSGILECPCNGRHGGDPIFYPDSKTKIITHTYQAADSGECSIDQHIHTAETCFATAPTLGINATKFVNKTISDPTLPPSCSLAVGHDGIATVSFNSNGHGKCTGGRLKTGQSTTSQVGVTLSLELDSTNVFNRSATGQYCENNREDVLRTFPMSSGLIPAAYASRDACEAYCMTDDACWGCSVDCPSAPSLYGTLLEACQWSALRSCKVRLNWSGSIVGDVTEKNMAAGVARISVSGPADVWFGVGLNALRMCDEPYALVVNDKGVTEQKLGTCGDEGCHCADKQLEPSVDVVSNTVANGVRTVVMTRPLQGKTSDHFTFDPNKTDTLHLITAVGSSQTFAYHKNHGPAVISLTSVGGNTCVCDVGVDGQLCDAGGVHCGQFKKNCVPPAPAYPWGDLLAQKNPTCNSRTYAGGLNCCRHKRIMLDADQEVRPELLQYHIKFRFWFQEYKPAAAGQQPSHYDLPRIYYQTEANAGEYDIPPAFALPGKPIVGYPGWPLNKPTPGTTCTGTCPDGPDCDCVHTITYHWTMSEQRLIYAGGHCHAPSCISIELWRNDTVPPTILCRQLPVYGKGSFPADKWDEAGYVALPPCLWGEDEGLQPSQWLPKNTPVFSIKKNRNTHSGHFGEMASWQMRGVSFQLKSSRPSTFV